MVNRDRLVDRLRKSKASSQAAAKSKGFQVGCEWANTSAETIELQHLEAARSDWQSWEATLTTCEFDAYSASENLAFVIRPESEKDRHAAVDFWESVLGDDIEYAANDDWLIGFAEGALSVWDGVADEFLD